MSQNTIKYFPNAGPSDFGPQHDFAYRVELTPEPVIALWPMSAAATWWLWDNIPEWVDRVGASGYKFKPDEGKAVIEAMRKANLMSRSDYIQACEEQRELEHAQWACSHE